MVVIATVVIALVHYLCRSEGDMVWKCPPLHLPNWNHLWKWKQEMNANEIANQLETVFDWRNVPRLQQAATMLRQQQSRILELEGCINDCYTVQKMQAEEVHKVEAEIDKLKQVLQSIANEHIELSHDKIKWQCEDHVRWAKEALK